MTRTGWKTLVISSKTHKHLTQLKAELELKSYDQVLAQLLSEQTRKK